MSPANDLRRRLGAGTLIVLDGGMGTELQARGVPMDGEAWSAIANISHADIVRVAQEARQRTGESGVAVAGSLSDMALSGLITGVTTRYQPSRPFAFKRPRLQTQASICSSSR